MPVSEACALPDPADLAGSTWYHGSPERLHLLRVDSAITVYREIARVFSHKPPMVSVEWPDDSARWRSSGPISIRHSGSRPGFLYRVAEPPRPDDIRRHPSAADQPPAEDWEWLVTRELRLALIGPTEPRPEELLDAAEIRALRESVE